MKDWTGNKKTTFSTLGASSHSDHERQEHDYYATDPKSVEAILGIESFSDTIWEPACGEGHISKTLIEHGKSVLSTDLIYRGYGTGGIDFLDSNDTWNGDIITNPPYKYAQEFIEKSIESIEKSPVSDLKIAVLLKLTFLEGQKRKLFFKKHPPKIVYVFSQRQKCALNGDFKDMGSSAVCYAWFIWQKGFNGEPIIRWI